MASRFLQIIKKGLFFVTVALAGTLFFPTNSFAASGSFTLTPASISTATGQTFSVKIDINTGGDDTDGAKAILLYDKTLLEVTRITPGTLYSSYPETGKVIDNTTGTARVTGIVDLESDETFNGTGTFATVDFTAKAAGKATIKFDFVGPYDANNETTMRDSNIAGSAVPGSDILTTVSTTSITIAGTPATGGSSGGNVLPSTASLSPTVILASIGSFLLLAGIAVLFVL